ncbi:hypothetical protein HPP92_017537 [Vanilla planifolia]|uniref:RNase H type-1 domain-containing protein n=1 Tax=Vanilla planifolia TaxID=51239 RepID=A0A835QL26_VANPL|nr:hypothetical protein HPP92_017537 [Vanilla planifolia]
MKCNINCRKNQEIMKFMAVVLFFLWFNRNKRKHDENLLNLKALHYHITAIISPIAAGSSFSSLPFRNPISPMGLSIKLQWTPPTGWIKCNYGAALAMNSAAAIVLIVRDYMGMPLKFMGRKVISTSLSAVETIAILYVLEYLSCHYPNAAAINLESDSNDAVMKLDRVIHAHSDAPLSFYSIYQCYQLCSSTECI